ncbi:hypothetical protein [Comamonas odontotermitis]|uniref:hypothetical protein n=1 Tax=Comamonas odontotermitis TaxID=379895 RepID=UPI001CC7ADA6|nr:hypothetical protein [Comamonas odontotermitis]UBB18802.1 hypothetical protein LAD35_09325 [Comamonas odontotermitis]
MTRLFEFADSEISRIETLPAGLVIRFAAAMLCVPEANEALSSRRSLRQGYTNGLSLVLTGALVTGDMAACTGRLAEGQLVLVQERLRALPVPSLYAADGAHGAGGAALRLELQSAQGAWLRIDATGLRCEEAADARFHEVFQC